MGLENCDKNVWAVALKEIVIKKSKEQYFYLSEEERNNIITRNNDNIIKGIQAVLLLEQIKGEIIISSLSLVINDIEKIHINRVKEILIKALNT